MEADRRLPSVSTLKLIYEKELSELFCFVTSSLGITNIWYFYLEVINTET